MGSKADHFGILFFSFVIVGVFYAVTSVSNGDVPDLWQSIASPATELKNWLHEKLGTWPMVGIGLAVLLLVVVLSYGIASLAAANFAIRIFMISIYPLTWPVVVSGVVGWIIVLIVLLAGKSPFSGARGVVLFFRL